MEQLKLQVSLLISLLVFPVAVYVYWKTQTGSESKAPCDNKIQTNNTCQKDLEKRLEDLEERMNKFQARIDEKINDLDSKTKEQVTELTEMIGSLKGVVIPKDNLFYVVMVLFAIQVGLCIFVFFCDRGSGYGSLSSPKASVNAREVLARVKSPQHLDSAICLISFEPGHTETYMTLLRSALKRSNVPIQPYTIQRHADICNLPHCRLYIMFVEYSERHVIIEQPELGLGDLKRTTHDAVLKMQGELMIIYYRDPASRTLDNLKLYNHNIYCVRDQPELQSLNNNGRFVSVYDRFTPHQSEHVNRVVSQTFQ